MSVQTLPRALLFPAVCLFFVTIHQVFAFAPTNNGGPPDGQSNVPTQALVDREFDLNLSGATLTVGSTGTVLLQANTGNVQGGAAAGQNFCLVARFFGDRRVECDHMTDNQPLLPDTWYSFTLKSDIKTATGMTLGADSRYQFRTTSFAGGADFAPPPVVIGSVPRAGTKLPTNAKIRVYFTVGGTGALTTMRTGNSGSVLSPANVQLFAAANGRPSNNTNLLACSAVGANPALPSDCNMSWNSSGSELVITAGKRSPGGSVDSTGGTALTAGNQYVLVVKGMQMGQGGGGSTGVRNTNNTMMMGDFYVPFTATGTDLLGPTVKGTFPNASETGVDRAIYNIGVGFTEPVEAGSIDPTTVKLFRDDGENGTFDPGTDPQITDLFVDYIEHTEEAALSPVTLLAANTKHYVVVTTGVKDIAGNTFDGDRATVGNQDKVIEFTTGTAVNGDATDSTQPKISFANANNFSVAVTFTEPVQFDNDIAPDTSSALPFVVNNIKNWTLQSPTGVPVNLNGKRIDYTPSSLTLTIYDLMMPPNQTFQVKVATNTGAVKIKDLTGNLVLSTGSGNIARGTVQNAQESGALGPGGGGEEFDFSKTIKVFPRSPMAGVTSNYEVEFNAATSIPSGGKILLTYPSGFSFVADGGSTECQDIVTAQDNNDINGPATGTVTIASVVCDGPARTITVTTGGAATVAGDRVRFLLQGIKNSTVPKDFNTSGYSVDVKTKGLDGSLLESKSSMPFFLNTPGSQSIAGTVFNDSGAGGGTANDGTKNGSEPGIQSIKVCMSGQNGFNCTATDVNGAYSFTQISNGFYKLDIPPLGAGSFIGGPFFRDVNLSGGSNATGINFAFRSSDRSISVTVAGIPSNADVDVFAFNSQSGGAGGQIVRELLWNGSASRTVTVPVSDGTWEIGVGPWMSKDPTLGPQPPPTFTFMPPKPQQVKVNGAGSYAASFALATANRSIKGKVVDSASSGISNAFVFARPTGSGSVSGGFAQTDANGNFTLNVQNGVYVVEANIPGMPPSTQFEVTVQDNASNADSNSTADVYSEGLLFINDGDGGIDNLLLKIAKGSLYISGRVLDESSNAISYAHVMAQQVDGSGNPTGPFMGSPTDTSGNFTIYVQPGNYKLFAHAPQYGELPSTTVTVAAGTNATGQNIQAATASFGTVSGTVSKGGTAVAGAFVNISGTGGGNSTITDSSGQYTMKVRAGSSYTINGFLPGSGPLTPLTAITVTAGETLGSQDLSMAAAGTIKVTLTGSTTITDAFVELRDSNGRGNGTNVNTTPGIYEIPVPAGTYTVRAQNPRLGLIGSRASVVVTANETTTVGFTPATTYVVSGTISSNSTTCTVGAFVAFADATNGRATSTTSITGGTYSIQLPNGTYRLTAGKPGCIDSEAPATITVNGAAVSTGTNRTLTAADSTVSGRVTLSSTGVTVPTVVIAESSTGKFAFADVDTTKPGGDNNYTLNLTAGSWTVRARAEGYESTSTSVTVTSSHTANLALSEISGYTRKDPKTSTMTPSRGGIVYDTNIGGGFEMNVPAGALGSDSDSASLTTKQTTGVADETPTAVVPGGKGFEITAVAADGSKVSDLSSSVEITLPYIEADVTAAGGTEANLVGAVWENDQWTPLSSTVDTTNNTITIVTSHFSTFAPIVPTGGGTTTTTTTTTTTSTGGGGGGSGRGRRTSPVTGINAAGTLAQPHPGPVVVAPGTFRTVRAMLLVSIDGKDVAFRDVPAKSWFASYVATVLEAGIASGYKDAQGNPKGEYGPANNVTYGEIAKMTLEGGGFGPASGVPANRSAHGHWSASYMMQAEDLQLSVYLDAPDVGKPATRGAVIQTLVEALDITEPSLAASSSSVSTSAAGTGSSLAGSGALLSSGSSQAAASSVASSSVASSAGSSSSSAMTSSAGGSASSSTSQSSSAPAKKISFKDLSSKHPHAGAILLLAKLGVISGDADTKGAPTGKVRPDAPINRAEVAKIFTKLIELGYL